MQIAPSVILIVELYIVIMFSHHGDLDQTLGEGRGSKFMEEEEWVCRPTPGAKV